MPDAIGLVMMRSESRGRGEAQVAEGL